MLLHSLSIGSIYKIYVAVLMYSLYSVCYNSYEPAYSFSMLQ